MAENKSFPKAAPTIDYEELLEEVEKLDIADLMLIHRKVSLR